MVTVYEGYIGGRVGKDLLKSYGHNIVPYRI
jgi:hypothetical protein